jgi:hypothetical protein
MLAKHRVSRATLREVAAWARQAAETMEAVAGVDPPDVRGVSFGGDSDTGGNHVRAQPSRQASH